MKDEYIDLCELEQIEQEARDEREWLEFYEHQ